MRNVLLAMGIASALAWTTWATPARACTNDVDCPNPACGGQVCQWGAQGHNCVDAGTDIQGSDGWCTVDSDCKCMGIGARCAAPHCTFTLPAFADAGSDAAPPVDAGTDAGSDSAAPVDSGPPPADSGAADSGGGVDSGSGDQDSGVSTTRPDSGAPNNNAGTDSGSGGGCALRSGDLGGPLTWGAGLALVGAVLALRKGRKRGGA